MPKKSGHVVSLQEFVKDHTISLPSHSHGCAWDGALCGEDSPPRDSA